MAFDIKSYVKAGYPLLWLRSDEIHRGIQDVVHQILQIKPTGGAKPYEIASWDLEQGINMLYTKPFPDGKKIDGSADTSPETAVKWLFGDMKKKQVLVMQNMHWCMEQENLVQQLINVFPIMKSYHKHIICIGCQAAVPSELKRVFTVLDYKLPTIEEITLHATEVLKVFTEDQKDANGDILNKARMKLKKGKLKAIAENGVGLTRFEFETALVRASLASAGRDVSIDIIREQKHNLIRQSSTLEVGNFKVQFGDLFGLDNMKQFCKQVAPHPLSRGILIIGPPGTGKSDFSKALGYEINRPTIQFDMSRVFGSYLGQSETNLRQSLQIIDAMAPNVVFNTMGTLLRK